MKRSLLLIIIPCLFTPGAAWTGDESAQKPKTRKSVSLSFEGEVVERFNSQESPLDSVNVTSFRAQEKERGSIRKPSFKQDVKKSLREVGDLR